MRPGGSKGVVHLAAGSQAAHVECVAGRRGERSCTVCAARQREKELGAPAVEAGGGPWSWTVLS